MGSLFSDGTGLGYDMAYSDTREAEIAAACVRLAGMIRDHYAVPAGFGPPAPGLMLTRGFPGGCPWVYTAAEMTPPGEATLIRESDGGVFAVRVPQADTYRVLGGDPPVFEVVRLDYWRIATPAEVAARS